MSKSIGVIGGGINGVALARALAERGDQVTVLEKENRLAAHQSGHNSGVLHAGLYYQPGSLKARLCSRGRAMLAEYCQEHALPYAEVGKVVVAKDTTELGGLQRIWERTQANRVPDAQYLSAGQVAEIEPAVRAVAGVHSPRTAVTDFAAVTEHLGQQVRRAGSQILLHAEVTAVRQELGKVYVASTVGEFVFDRLIVCAGLHSDKIATMVGASPDPRILPFRGEYWHLAPTRRQLVSGMIYPVPDPRLPFLGVHFTRGVYDDVHVGPNAVPALSREGYSWSAISIADTLGSLRWPGAAALAKRYWRTGLAEVAASLLKPLYLKQAQAYLPQLEAADLEYKGAAGVRAQAWSADGSLLDDFAIDTIGPVTLIRNAPSPAATSSLAIAEYVLAEHFR